jgi:hypothetical protein
MTETPFPKKQLSTEISHAIGKLEQGNEAEAGILDDEISYEMPQSIILMTELLHQEIERQSNNVEYEDLSYKIGFDTKDESYIICFVHTDKNAQLPEDEPYFHEEISAFLSTLSTYANNKVKIDTDELCIYAVNKMSLFDMIRGYIEDPENEISHADTVALRINHEENFDNPEHEEQIRPQIVDHILRQTAQITENIYQNETMADQFLYTTTPEQYKSKKDFYTQSGLQRYVDNNHSLSHILKTIMFEQGEDVNTPPNGWDLTLSAGGYH